MKLVLVLLLTILFSSAALSNDFITIYKEKDVKSEVIEKVNTDDELLTVLIDGCWSRVKDPSNGKSGWIENNEKCRINN
ncbi:hypothetical protein [Photobacterium damselae]|uniref:hypothetical protein n=1 Tax=Photobacterium damselae TaxID=38293 RepID=UPI0030F39ABE